MPPQTPLSWGVSSSPRTWPLRLPPWSALDSAVAPSPQEAFPSSLRQVLVAWPRFFKRSPGTGHYASWVPASPVSHLRTGTASRHLASPPPSSTVPATGSHPFTKFAERMNYRLNEKPSLLSQPLLSSASKGRQYLHREMEREMSMENEEGAATILFWDLPLHSPLGRGPLHKESWIINWRGRGRPIWELDQVEQLK